MQESNIRYFYNFRGVTLTGDLMLAEETSLMTNNEHIVYVGELVVLFQWKTWGRPCENAKLKIEIELL